MKKLLYRCLSVFCFFSWFSAMGQVKLVDPFLGSAGEGHVFVGPSWPFGMVKAGPDCGKGFSNSGYLADQNETVIGFSQVHVSGTGGGAKYGNIQLMPFSDEADKIDQRSLRKNEIAELGYYAVDLKKDDIKVGIAVSAKAAFHRYIYSHPDKGLKIDAGFFLGENYVDPTEAQYLVGSEIELISPYEVKGYSRVRGGWNGGGAYTVFFDAVFDQPVTRFSTWRKDVLFPGKKLQVDSGQKTGALLHFGNAAHDTLLVKIGISFISAAKARQNMDLEIPHWDFDKLVTETRAVWEKQLKKIEVAPEASVDQQKMFYTALYHTMLMPVDRTGENPLWESDLPYYDDYYAIWDTFRTSSPLLALIAPEREAGIVNSLINIYQHEGYMPDARSGNYNGRTQGGSHAEAVIADAYIKGLGPINYEDGLMAMLKDADVPPGGNEEKEGRGGLTDYNSIGYVSNNYVRSGNRTVDYAFDDYCIAVLAKGLDKKDLFDRFKKQSGNWRNLWRGDYKDHGATGFILPRAHDGKWLDHLPYALPDGETGHFSYGPLTDEKIKYVCWWCCFLYEGTSWEYSLSVPHGVPQLIKLSGGQQAFINRLDTLFRKGYYNVANEPSFLTPCLYNWVGRPDLTTFQVRRIIQKNFNASSKGLPGNDDSGAMSSWLAFHLMGLYPNTAQPYYLLHAPLMPGVTIHLPNGKDFKISIKNWAKDKQEVESVTLNGKTFDQAWISHGDLVKGGDLIFTMGSQKSDWGKNKLPPSGEL